MTIGTLFQTFLDVKSAVLDWIPMFSNLRNAATCIVTSLSSIMTSFVKKSAPMVALLRASMEKLGIDGIAVAIIMSFCLLSLMGSLLLIDRTPVDCYQTHVRSPIRAALSLSLSLSLWMRVFSMTASSIYTMWARRPIELISQHLGFDPALTLTEVQYALHPPLLVLVGELLVDVLIHQRCLPHPATKCVRRTLLRHPSARATCMDMSLLRGVGPCINSGRRMAKLCLRINSLINEYMEHLCV